MDYEIDATVADPIACRCPDNVLAPFFRRVDDVLEVVDAELLGCHHPKREHPGGRTPLLGGLGLGTVLSLCGNQHFC